MIDGGKCPSCGVLYEDHLGLIGTCRKLQTALAVIAELQAQNAENHEPAGLYRLLVDRLRGVPTNPGGCPVAARLDALEAIIARLPKTAAVVDAARRLRDARLGSLEEGDAEFALFHALAELDKEPIP